MIHTKWDLTPTTILLHNFTPLPTTLISLILDYEGFRLPPPIEGYLDHPKPLWTAPDIGKHSRWRIEDTLSSYGDTEDHDEGMWMLIPILGICGMGYLTYQAVKFTAAAAVSLIVIPVGLVGYGVIAWPQ